MELYEASYIKKDLNTNLSFLLHSMRILWITNITFPEVQRLLSGIGFLKASGGWMLRAAETLSKMENIKLTVASLSRDVNCLTRLMGEKIVYYLLPYGKGNYNYNSDYESLWKEVKLNVKPDIVHIHGSEFTHGLAYVKACGSENVVVSIQGLVSICERYYYSGLNMSDIRGTITIRSLFGRSIINEQRSFKKRGELEIELIKNVNHIIGRTSWDRAHSWVYNPDANYYHVGESLRSEFYDGQWDYSKCHKHSIFLSQANYSIKGLHMILKALPLVLRHYPDTILRVAGVDITKCSSIKSLIHFTDYGKIIRRMIKKYCLNDVVSFIGPLDAESMKSEYLRANIFVCPSSIENSPNSLGEAQLLGVPVISSYVGGIMDMMRGDESHIYRFEEIEMLAVKICDIFAAGDHQPHLPKMREIALQRHDPENNNVDLLNVYKQVARY